MEQKKLVKCLDNHEGENYLTIGKVYEVLKEEHGWFYVMNDDGWESCYEKHEFKVVKDESEEIPVSIDSHYNFVCDFKVADDVEMRFKVDPYFVAKQWKLGSKDDTGVLFHILKGIARFGDKNSKEREIVAMYKSIKRLAELEGVSLEN